MKNKVAEFRVKKGFTQEELAIRAGISRPYISEIETGSQKAITNVIMSKIADALNETVIDIFFSDDVVFKQQKKEENYVVDAEATL